MIENIKGKFIFTSPYGDKITVERGFTDKRALESYLTTMTKMGYIKTAHKTLKIDAREEGAGC